MIEFAIEFGSSNVVVYKKLGGIILKEASLIAYTKKKDDIEIIAVGNRAKKMLGKTDSNTIVCSPIKNGVIADEKLAYLLLGELLKKVCKHGLKLLKFNVLFCIGVGSTIDDLELFRRIATKLGALKVEFVPSVITSLIGAGINIDKPNGVLSLNLGGGTCQMAVVSMNTIINGYSLCFGGLKMDEAICLYVEQFLNLTISPHISENIKEEIGSLYAHDTSSLEISGTDTDTYSPRNDVIKSTDIVQALEFYFEKIVVAIKKLLNSCSPDIVADISQNGVYVTGGLANISGLEAYLRKHLNLPVIIVDDAVNASIIGAGALLSNKKQKIAIIKQM